MARNTARTATTPRSTRSTALSTPRARSPKPDDGSRLAPGSNPRRNGEPPGEEEEAITPDCRHRDVQKLPPKCWATLISDPTLLILIQLRRGVVGYYPARRFNTKDEAA